MRGLEAQVCLLRNNNMLVEWEITIETTAKVYIIKAINDRVIFETISNPTDKNTREVLKEVPFR